MAALLAMVLSALGCAGTGAGNGPGASGNVDPGSTSESAHFVLAGGALPGGTRVDVEVEDGRIVALGTVSAKARRVDLSGRFLVPAFIDSHVHLAFLPERDAMLDGGVAAALDWGAPIGFLSEGHGELELRASGPMITAVGGYPTRSWGRNGYGAECADLSSARAALDRHKAAGATLAKFVFTGPPELDAETLGQAVGYARELGLEPGAHALTDAGARQAAAAGIRVLVHVPTQRLSEEALANWSDGTIISTLAAFGSSDAAIDNLRALRERGATVLYGTDFGNLREAGISRRELEALTAAGLDGQAIIDAGTTAPAERWGLESGRIAVGAPASLVVLDADPLIDVTALTRPTAVYTAGRPRP